ncbi:unnamed protein product [Sphagnum compactum]
MPGLPVDLNLGEAQLEDPALAAMIDLIKEGHKLNRKRLATLPAITQAIAKKWHSFSIINNILVKTVGRPDNSTVSVIVLPSRWQSNKAVVSYCRR